ncbi:MAG: transcription-repair coupling factor [Ruminococcaceae bacterium]|nr:transcription-repair coupling factor [Oscillospiraceae bacterium]
MANDIWKIETQPLFRAVDAGQCPVLVSGVGAASRAHMVSSLRRQFDVPLFVVCSDDTAAETMARDLESLLGERVSLLPWRDFNLYSTDGAARLAEQKRIAALDFLAREEVQITVCAVGALLQRTMPKSALLTAAFDLRDGQEIAIEAVETALLEAGYVHRVQTDAPGQYSRRGGILDIFSPALPNPVRMEFWGDEIDSMGTFDINTQRRIENISACRILPAAETLPQLAQGGACALADTLDLEAVKAARGRSPEKQKLAATLRGDAEKLRQGVLLPAADRYAGLIYPEFSCALDYIPESAFVFLDQPVRLAKLAEDQQKLLHEDIKAQLQCGTLIGAYADFLRPWESAAAALCEAFPVVMGDSFTQGRCLPEPRAIVSVTAKQLPGYGGSLDTACDDVRHYISSGFAVLVLAADERRAQSLQEFFARREISARILASLADPLAPGECGIAVGALSGGFEYPQSRFAVLTDAQLMQSGLRRSRRGTKKLPSNRKKLESYADLSVGDLVVHEYHGIGRFAGIVQMRVDGVDKDYVKICYAGTDTLFVPATQLDLVSKYIGAGEDHPVKLSKMGGSDWSRTKTRAKAAAKKIAGELIALYAERRRKPGHAFAPDSPWQVEFEEAFGYEETDDQLRCIAEIKRDMESSVPMDRLLCGDVGYGKTEVALRAIMKCVLDGRQAAVLVPTTVLAQQHYQTAVQRFFGYPVRIEQLSRFRTPAQVRAAKAGIADGSVDIVIGTHALLQKDIRFKQLGLLVVDEEQRFGVSHKERLKEMSRNVDVLTLSATPIPRTLNMAMSGLRDMSTLEEPPQDRMPVQTYVMEHDWDIVADAIRREIQRGGQVYYLHNVVDSIERTAARIAKLLPEVSVAVAHGKMDQESISSAMEGMISGETQVLVCTTIIETGIDIPNVNTLIIEDADKLGLAQLHQIRGRVGRSSRRASAYLTYRKAKVLTEVAEKRLSAIREFAEFNAGFRIAMRDLEIRGAGSLLGAEQSGHMVDVGYDMYLQLLEEAVLEEQGKTPEVRADCAADLAVSANIPERYVSSPEIRMDLYRRIAQIRTEADADDLTDELIDRFGDPPPSVNSLVHVALLRGEATRAGITDIAQKSGHLRFCVADFNMERISALYAMPQFKGRLKVEAGAKPCLSLKLQSGRRVIEAAREFVAAYAAQEHSGAASGTQAGNTTASGAQTSKTGGAI